NPAPVATTGVSTINPSIVRGIVISKNGLNIRQTPSTSGKVLAIMPYNSKLEFVDNSIALPSTGAPKGWYKIKTSTGVAGYGSVDFITKIDGSGATVAGESYDKFDAGAEHLIHDRKYQIRA